MITEALFCAAVFVAAKLVTRWWKNISRWDHIPGPTKYQHVPFVGHAYLLGSDPAAAMDKLREKHGDIYRLDLGPHPTATVFLNDYDDVVEAYKSEAFSGRSFSAMECAVDAIRLRADDGQITGLAVNEGHAWKEHRKFTVGALSQLGIGTKGSMEEVIVDEARCLCDNTARLASRQGNRITIKNYFSAATNSVIWRILTGKRTSQNDDEILKLTKISKEVFDFFAPDKPFNMLQLYYRWAGRLFQVLGLHSMYGFCTELQQKIYNEAEAGTPVQDGSFVERHCYMQQVHRNDPNSIFNKTDGMVQLKGALWDLFLAGTDTSSTLLEWCTRYLQLYPEVQAKLHREIEEKIGSRAPTLADKLDLHYLQCFVEEVMRHSRQMDLGLPHRVTHDVTFRGVLFPEDTQVFANVGAIHFDKRYWKDPDNFRPERFLDEKGHFKADERICFFGIGKRRCAGEILARGEVFIFLASLIQQFQIKPVPGVPPALERDYGMVTYPKKYDAIVEARY